MTHRDDGGSLISADEVTWKVHPPAVAVGGEAKAAAPPGFFLSPFAEGPDSDLTVLARSTFVGMPTPPPGTLNCCWRPSVSAIACIASSGSCSGATCLSSATGRHASSGRPDSEGGVWTQILRRTARDAGWPIPSPVAGGKPCCWPWAGAAGSLAWADITWVSVVDGSAALPCCNCC